MMRSGETLHKKSKQFYFKRINKHEYKKNTPQHKAFLICFVNHFFEPLIPSSFVIGQNSSYAAIWKQISCAGNEFYSFTINVSQTFRLVIDNSPFLCVSPSGMLFLP